MLTAAAIVYSGYNYQAEREFQVPTDGVRWMEHDGGLQAKGVVVDGRGEKAGIRDGDQLSAVINGHEIKNSAGQVRQLYRAGIWSKATYSLVRGLSAG